ncbi:MAG: efflux RND transporter permease subunit, partial [Candidatus Glassbacteria bacterium]
LKKVLNLIWPEMKPRSWQDLIAELDRVMKFPGTTNAWTMPIKTRIDMLTTGIRTPIGIKIYGPELEKIQETGEHIEAILQGIEGTRSVYAERVVGGYFLDFDIKRDEVSRYGLTVGDVEDVIETAIGGKNITMTIEGRERYPVNVRYAREFRNDPEKLKRILVATPSGTQVPLGQLADISLTTGAPSIKDENGMLTGWVYVDIFEDRDIGSYVKEAKELIRNELRLPPGYYLGWSGQFEYMERARQRLLLVLPITVLIVIILIYINTGTWIETGFVLLAIPFSLIGAFWILYLLGYNMSIAVWVGIIALAGVDAETGVVLLLYLNLAYRDMKERGLMRNIDDLKEAVVHGAVRRVRPRVMTTGTTAIGLFPIMWAAVHEAGADVMKRIAAPMVGGIFTSFILGMLIYPVLFMVWKWRSEVREQARRGAGDE